ncbi:photosystem II D1 precursor processing protein PSB27-H2, chloroplastic-like isoform X2 [Hibiscus syriacus]|uniref:photosystem II D1 precursor processing protein PSB27-H2, chloroplastic-like isoform X2 n=1 Tax=Hibiscus syriacus TaxID=106335 RepID=UPI00192307C7|nr:photosystem II D1 precursor processing protein PSB27-H2, chloroplastic-like isoform X2 [Hibiscus syriacus]
MALNLAAKICVPNANSMKRPENRCKLQFRCCIVALCSSSRRHIIAHTAASLSAVVTFHCVLTQTLPVRAESDDRKEEGDEGLVGAFKSLLDPNEKTKSGKVLPKAYVKSVREVVKTLRESLQEDPKDVAKFRRTADSAKESIRDYLSNWRGQEKVAREESYIELEKAIRSLASFYSKAGPSAPLLEEIKNEILNDLNTAEECL